MASAGHTTVVHAGREEFRFCRRSSGARPANLFDIQIAAGLIGLDYPAAYGTLLQKLLGESLGKGETRTNWRRRPLHKRQLDYALQDVVYLEPLYDRIVAKLDEMGRRGGWRMNSSRGRISRSRKRRPSDGDGSRASPDFRDGSWRSCMNSGGGATRRPGPATSRRGRSCETT